MGNLRGFRTYGEACVWFYDMVPNFRLTLWHYPNAGVTLLVFKNDINKFKNYCGTGSLLSRNETYCRHAPPVGSVLQTASWGNKYNHFAHSIALLGTP